VAFEAVCGVGQSFVYVSFSDRRGKWSWGPAYKQGRVFSPDYWEELPPCPVRG